MKRKLTISVILKRSKILYHVSNAPDVASYGLLVPHVIDTKKLVSTSVSMNSSGVIAKRQRIYSSFTNKHVPVSFSLFSNIPGYDKDPIFVCHDNVKELIDIFVKTLVDMSAKAYAINIEKY